MSIQKRNLICGCFLPVVFLFAVSARAQIAPREYAYTLRSTSLANHDSNSLLLLPSLSEGTDGVTVANRIGHKDNSVSEPAPSAVNDVSSRDKVGGQDFTACGSPKGVIQVVAAPATAEKTPPTTLTVRTAALLELHAMRQNAVDLCLQLPTRYRTQLPQCADIFRHEIRLKALAKERQ
jgi:hypothetical protein